jgi:hypothetical protein
LDAFSDDFARLDDFEEGSLLFFDVMTILVRIEPAEAPLGAINDDGDAATSCLASTAAEMTFESWNSM